MRAIALRLGAKNTGQSFQHKYLDQFFFLEKKARDSPANIRNTLAEYSTKEISVEDHKVAQKLNAFVGVI